jgi:hypothetical protein
MKVETNIRAGRMPVTATGGGGRVKGTCTGTVVA